MPVGVPLAGEGWDGLNKPVPAPGSGLPPPEGSTYATITVYRDAKRVFISAYVSLLALDLPPPLQPRTALHRAPRLTQRSAASLAAYPRVC